MLNKVILCIITFCSLIGGNCSFAQQFYVIDSDFDSTRIPPAPTYDQLANWAAHPDKVDMADTVPYKSVGISDGQGRAVADVFFVHPTIYTYEPQNEYIWNADIRDADLNRKVDETAILNQATAFNGSCRVFAPRYRQAHYSAFTTNNLENKNRSLAVAYADVRNAFLYYLEHENHGRPIVIAAHSQGTIHARWLIKEFVDGKPLQKQFVEAYLVGIATPADFFDTIQPSKAAEETGGFVTWNTFLKGFYPDYYTANGLNEAICTNPLTWQVDNTYAPRDCNTGGVGLKYTFVERPVDAQVHDGMLWISKPYIRGRMFIRSKIWHRADINLFWMNIRENVALRLNTFLANDATSLNGSE